MTENRECLACGGHNFVFLFWAEDYISREVFRVEECRVCGLAITLPLLTDQALPHYYKGLYYGQRKSFTENLINRGRVRAIQKFHSKGPLLDVGCGNGSFLQEMQK